MLSCYVSAYYSKVEEQVNSGNKLLHQRKNTEHSRVILALTALGFDPTQVSGYNLLLPLADYDGTLRQGINGPIWALIALDSAAYTIPVHPTAANLAPRESHLSAILPDPHRVG